MAGLRDLARDIVCELKRIDSMPAADLAEEWKVTRNFPLPGMIGRGDGHGILISPKIDNDISEIVKLYLNKQPVLKNTHSNAELHKLIQNMLGLTLAQIDDLYKNENDVIEQILGAIDASITSQTTSVEDAEYAFGCSLFGDHSMPTFSIGPVRFENRADWIERKKSDGGISNSDYEQVKRIWSKTVSDQEVNSRDKFRQDAIVDAIGNAPYVCSVSVRGLPKETGREKALTVARFALAAISLIWNRPSSALEGIGLSYDRQPYIKRNLSFSKNGLRGGGGKWSHSPHGPFVEAEKWKDLLREYNSIFTVSGQVFDYILTPDNYKSRADVFKVLSLAFIWFHAGSREEDNLIAIVKYAACLDTLSNGGETRGICRLITKQLGIAAEDPIFKNDDRRMIDVVKHIYGYGRSRTMHGSNDRFGHDWSTIRTEAELLVRHCLVYCLSWAGSNPTVNDPDCFSR